MGAWHDRNGTLGKKLFVKLFILSVFLSFLSGVCHFWLVSAIFSCFSSTFACCSVIYLPFLPLGRTVWQSNLTQQLGRNKLEKLSPRTGINAGRKGLNFGRMEWSAPPENDTATLMTGADLHQKPVGK